MTQNNENHPRVSKEKNNCISKFDIQLYIARMHTIVAQYGKKSYKYTPGTRIGPGGRDQTLDVKSRKDT